MPKNINFCSSTKLVWREFCQIDSDSFYFALIRRVSIVESWFDIVSISSNYFAAIYFRHRYNSMASINERSN